MLGRRTSPAGAASPCSLRLSCLPAPAPKASLNARGVSVALYQWDGKNENSPPSVSGSIIHTANSYALEMEAVRENQCGPVRDLTHRPLLLSSSNASHALLLLLQAVQVWARALYPEVEGCGLPAAVRARISSVKASLTMHSALAQFAHATHCCVNGFACKPCRG